MNNLSEGRDFINMEALHLLNSKTKWTRLSLHKEYFPIPPSI